MSRRVLASATFHWLATTERAPAACSARVSPTIPSPRTLAPRPVSHADSTTSSALSLSWLAISQAWSRPSSRVISSSVPDRLTVAGGASSTPDDIGWKGFR